MESGVNEVHSPSLQENQKEDENTTTENFQGFIYNLFEKNGILNDLRAHLRGHIVTVLRTARTGEVPACQQQFTQRLELRNQAFNMLIAEYLVRLEFNYTLSVFVSEIPLANMVFGFAQSLLRYSPEKALTEIFLSEDDVCSLLNHLGLQLDSEHASHILRMYRTEHKPLLGCIFNCMPLCKESHIEPDNQSDCTESSSQTSDTSSLRNKHSYKNYISNHVKCKHYKSCKACQNKIAKLKAASKEKKKMMAEMRNQKAVNVTYNSMFMKNISEMERTLIHEMFQQLQTVYEEEIEILKCEEQKRTRRSAESCMSQLEKKRDEERILKTQLVEAQETLKKRGEEMKTLISNEIEILVVHLKAMKKEKDRLIREKQEFEAMKCSCETEKSFKLKNVENQNSPTRFDMIEIELSAVKKCMETIKSQAFVAETSTNTEVITVSLNNEQERITADDTPSSHRVNPNQVVNDFKKQKNINLSTAEEIRRSRSRSRSPSDIEPATLAADRQTQPLREENERLKIFARQQQEHIEKLTSLQTRLQAELTTARCRIDNLTLNRQQPQPEPFYVTMQRASASTPPFRLAGRGEEVMAYSAVTPHVIIPGDDVPFLGVIEGHTAGKRHLIRQWRALRKATPPRGVSKAPRPLTSHRECSTRINADVTQHATTPGTSNMAPEVRESETHRVNTPNTEMRVKKEKTPASKHAKGPVEKSHKKNKILDTQSNRNREKSPKTIVKEAKRQLRKLEIEAEAVEQSYLTFRKRQTERQVEKAHEEPLSSTSKPVAESIAYRKDLCNKHREDPRKMELHLAKQGYYNVLKEYKHNYDEYFKNRNTASYLVKPIPEAFAETEENPDKHNDNYLEKPLAEFRKLYRSRNSRRYLQNAEQIETIEFASKNEVNENLNKLAEDNKERDSSKVKEVIGIIEQDPEKENHLIKAKLNEIQDEINTENQEIKVLPVNNIHKLSTSETGYINNYLNAPTVSTKDDCYQSDNEADKDTNVHNIIYEQGTNETYTLEEPINNFLNAPTLSTKKHFKPVNEVNVHSEIPKQNINKTHVLEELMNHFLNAPMLSTNYDFEPDDEVGKDINVHSEISEISFNKTHGLKDPVEKLASPTSDPINAESTHNINQKTQTCVEPEPKSNLLISVDSTEVTQITETEKKGKKNITEITVIITPKVNKTDSQDIQFLEEEDNREVQANLNRNEEAIFSENHNLSKSNKEIIDSDKTGSDEYGDDFSADIDVSSKTDISNDNISVHETENDNDDFWD